VYRIVVHPEAAAAIVELPAHLLPSYAEAVEVLERSPWEAPSHNPSNPAGAVRRKLFGALGMGHILYLVLEREREVQVLRVVWFDLPTP
jgi:hypothetical protein